jgi:hypothetical protein
MFMSSGAAGPSLPETCPQESSCGKPFLYSLPRQMASPGKPVFSVIRQTGKRNFPPTSPGIDKSNQSQILLPFRKVMT